MFDEIDKLYTADVIRDDIKFLSRQKKYEYIAELELTTTQQAAMIDIIGRIVTRLNESGIMINNKVYNTIVVMAAKQCKVTPY
jgi:hypothetical protein